MTLSRWEDALLAARIFAVDPAAIGGLLVRAQAGPVRDRFLTALRENLLADFFKLPLHATEDRLLGGLDLAATLRAGRVIAETGLLARAHGGAILAAMAERLAPASVAHLCSALDLGEVALERDGISRRLPARLGVVALDEGLEDERTAAPLRERLAIHLDLQPISLGETDQRFEDGQIGAARALLPRVQVPGDVVEALCAAAASLGVGSIRAPILACAVARAAAALDGRTAAGDSDAEAAARLVLGPRATRAPSAPPEAPEQQPDDEAAPREPPAGESEGSEETLQDLVLAAAVAALPAGLLEELAGGGTARTPNGGSGRKGAARTAQLRGRPAGTRAGKPGGGARLNLIETLRAAAPWQRLRRGKGSRKRVEVRLEDFRIARYQERTETTTIFAVDASGSSALQRLAEAKGAVEQLLGDCYIRRDNVALVAFRGGAAEVLLPPTRSLVRARRALAGLPGGGGTPLAAGLEAALKLALDSRRRGQTPVIVLMTDGRANVSRQGSHDRPAAEADATAAARAIRTAGVRTLFLDTAPRARPDSQLLAREMAARYLPLPYADPGAVSRQIQALSKAR